MSSNTVSINQQKLELTPKEAKLYHLLSQTQREHEECVTYMQFGHVVQEWPKDLSWDALESSDQESIKNGFKAHVNNLNRKLEAINPDLRIESVTKKGYRLPELDKTERAPNSLDAMLSYDESSSNFYLSLKEVENAARFPIDDTVSPWIIGRNPSTCNILINNKRVSKIHACIFPQEGQWFIHDGDQNGSRSTHGTYIHSEGGKYAAGTGKPNARLLRDGDRIEIARELYYRFEDFSS